MEPADGSGRRIGSQEAERKVRIRAGTQVLQEEVVHATADFEHQPSVGEVTCGSKGAEVVEHIDRRSETEGDQRNQRYARDELLQRHHAEHAELDLSQVVAAAQVELTADPNRQLREIGDFARKVDPELIGPNAE